MAYEHTEKKTPKFLDTTVTFSNLHSHAYKPDQKSQGNVNSQPLEPGDRYHAQAHKIHPFILVVPDLDLDRYKPLQIFLTTNTCQWHLPSPRNTVPKKQNILSSCYEYILKPSNTTQSFKSK